MTEPQLTTTQYKALSALMAGASVTDAAQQAGVSERTLYRYLADSTFDAAYRAARRRAVGQATTKLQQIAGEAVEMLRAVMTDTEASDRARVAAASKILDLAYKAVELDDLESRIKALEEKYAQTP